MENNELSEKINASGFAAVLEAAADMNFGSSRKSFTSRKSRAGNSKKILLKLDREKEATVIAGVGYFSSVFFQVNARPIDFVIRLGFYENNIIEEAYAMTVSNGNGLKEDERRLAEKLYLNRENIVLASIHEKTSPLDRMTALRLSKMPPKEFENKMGAIRGRVTEEYFGILFSGHISPSETIKNFTYYEYNRRGYKPLQTHNFEMDLIFTCPEDKFLLALSEIRKRKGVYIGLSPQLEERISKYDAGSSENSGILCF